MNLQVFNNLNSLKYSIDYFDDKMSYILAVWEYIEETRQTTGGLEQRVSSAKDNVESMNNIMAKWCDYPLYERKEKRGLLNLDVSYKTHKPAHVWWDRW